MSQPENPNHRPARARGTAPLDGYVSSSQSQAPTTQLIHREDLAREIAQAEKVIAAIRPRMKALERALAVSSPGSLSLDELFIGVVPNERNFTMQMAQILGTQSEVKRQAQIVVQQFQGALQGLKEAQEVLSQFSAGQVEVGRVEGFSLAKFKGTVYPLYNFSMTFGEVPMLESLFPRLSPSAPTQRLRMPAVASTQELRPEEDPIGKLSKIVEETPRLAPLKPIISRGIELLRKAQEAAPGFVEKVRELRRSKGSE